MNGHDLAREIIARHGRDRYPEAYLNLLKVAEELGELTAEMLTYLDRPRPDGPHAELRKEYADVGLALYAFGNKLGLNLEDEMRQVVENETRRFT